MDIKQIIKAIKPYVLEWIENVQAQDLGAHNLSGTMHSGTLSDGQGPQFLKTDGSRQLTGDLTVAALKTIDGIDISVLGGTVSGHVGATATAGHGSVGAHNHQTAANGDLLDHGAALSGLADDDHTQYLNTTRHDTTTRHTLGTVVPHDDHGALSGLADDDHTQYLLINGTRDMAGNLLPALSDTYDLGSSLKLWRKGYLSELEALVFAEQTIQLVGGWLMICKNQGTIVTGVNTTFAKVDFGTAMTPGDIVLFRAAGKVEYMLVGALVSGTSYTVTRNLDGSGGNDWPAGAAFAVLGASGTGRIELNAYDTPRISVMKQGTTYNANTELIRIGDLNGNWGYGSEKYGIAIGEYLAGKANMVLDEDGVLRIRRHGTDIITFGTTKSEILNVLELGGTDSALAIGNPPPTSATVGTGLWLSRAGLVSLNANAAGLVINSSGLTLKTVANSVMPTTAENAKITFLDGSSNTLSSIFNYSESSPRIYDYLTMVKYAVDSSVYAGKGILLNVLDPGSGTGKVSLMLEKRFYPSKSYTATLSVDDGSGAGASALIVGQTNVSLNRFLNTPSIAIVPPGGSSLTPINGTLVLSDLTSAPAAVTGGVTLYNDKGSLFAKHGSGHIANLDGASVAGLLMPFSFYNLRALWNPNTELINGAGGYVADLSPNQRHLVQNNMSWGDIVGGAASMNTYAAGFNGTSSYLSYPSLAGLSGTTYFTFGTWMRFSNFQRSHGIFRVGTTTSSIQLIYYYPGYNPGSFELGFWDTGNVYRQFKVNFTASNNTWHYIGVFWQYPAAGDNYLILQIDNSTYNVASGVGFSVPRAPVGGFEIGRAGGSGTYYLSGIMATAWMAGNITGNLQNYYYATKGIFGL